MAIDSILTAFPRYHNTANYTPDVQLSNYIEFGFNQLILLLLKKNIEINTFHHKKYWLDIGRPNDYEKAQQDYEKLNFIKK